MFSRHTDEKYCLINVRVAHRITHGNSIVAFRWRQLPFTLGEITAGFKNTIKLILEQMK